MRVRVLLAIIATVLGGCALQRDIVGVPANGQLGTAAPVLQGETLSGNHASVDFHGAKTVLVFWAAWCGPCRHEQPGLNQLAQDFASQGIRFYGVDMLDHDRALATAFVQEFRVTYPSLYDDSGKLAAAYEVDEPPSFVLVDGRGVVVGRYPGEASADQLRGLIQQKLIT